MSSPGICKTILCVYKVQKYKIKFSDLNSDGWINGWIVAHAQGLSLAGNQLLQVLLNTPRLFFIWTWTLIAYSFFLAERTITLGFLVNILYYSTVSSVKNWGYTTELWPISKPQPGPKTAWGPAKQTTTTPLKS